MGEASLFGAWRPGIWSAWGGTTMGEDGRGWTRMGDELTADGKLGEGFQSIEFRIVQPLN